MQLNMDCSVEVDDELPGTHDKSFNMLEEARHLFTLT